MATREERVKILKMLEEGKLSAEEATRLLQALTRGKVDRKASKPEGKARWLRVRVTDLSGEKTSATVTVPTGLENVGLKLGAQFIPNVEELDLEKLSEALQQGITGKVVEVVDEAEGQRVEIYVE